MKKIFTIICFFIGTLFVFAQKILTIEGTITRSTELNAWEGVNIPRNILTLLTYRNNSITSLNASGYMLQAGDEGANVTKNNLPGAVITGNVFSWNGTDGNSITHGVFTGYNLNAIINYNYLNNVPMGIIRKSDGMTNTSGGIAYNIIKDGLVAVNIKGMNGVCVYNNTFYSNKTAAETYRGIIQIYSNDSPVAASTGTKIKNNIFYTTYQISNITIEDVACVKGFESDYNIFWCEAGTPTFNYLGVSKTFAQWQALGYDTHSVIVNPNFTDITNFVPKARLDYGTNLGASWQSGLSTDATWGKTDPKTSVQNGLWQVGSRVYAGTNGISDQTSGGISIYPNPVTNGLLKVKLDEKIHDQFDLLIFDLSGKTLLQKHYQQTNSLLLDLSALPAAEYLIQIISASFHFSDKFIIQ